MMLRIGVELDRGFGTRPNSQLVEDVVDVNLCCSGTDEEQRSDLLIR